MNSPDMCCCQPAPKRLAILTRSLIFLALFMLLESPAHAVAESVVPSSSMPWWFWPLALFVTCFLIGIVAVPAGIGGGTLFVPIIGGFFPFHLDFVRGAGLLVALASALAAGHHEVTVVAWPV